MRLCCTNQPRLFAPAAARLSQNNIKTLYFRSIYGKKIQENENLKEVHNWGQVYTAIKNGLDF